MLNMTVHFTVSVVDVIIALSILSHMSMQIDIGMSYVRLSPPVNQILFLIKYAMLDNLRLTYYIDLMIDIFAYCKA